MDHGLQQDRLETVRTLATTLADRMLMDRMAGGSLPAEKGNTLWIASLLLEECEHPVPDIVTDVLAQFRQDAPAAGDDALEMAPRQDNPTVDSGSRRGGLFRLFKSMRPEVSA